MYAVSTAFLQALRGPHQLVSRVEVTWPDGRRQDLAFVDGQVAVESSRRTFTVEVKDMTAWRDITMGGAVLRPSRGLRYVDGSTEVVPLGVFEVRATEEDLAGLQAGRLTGHDGRRRVQRARYLTPSSSFPGLTYAAEWRRQLVGALPADTAYVDDSGSTDTCPRTVWPRDRDQAVDDLAAAIGCEWAFDVLGRPRLRPAPTLADDPVWTVDVGLGGVLLGGSAQRTDERTYNAVVVTASRPDGEAVPFDPVVVEDLDPGSRTFVGGPFGRVPRFYSSPLLRTTSQAVRAGRALLEKARGGAATVALESLVNPALESGDVLTVRLPDGRVQRHVVDAFAVGLDEGASLSLTTRAQADLPDEGST